MSDAPPVVPGHTLARALGRTGLWYVASSASGDEETIELTDPAVRPSVVALALAAREQAAQQRVTSEHLLRLREVVPLGEEVVALVRDPAAAGSLEDLVERRGSLHPGEVTTLLTPLATTLGELDTAGVVHGGLHPGRVLFTEQGKPVLTGFDAVRLVGEQHRHSRRGASAFDAPEVVLGAVPTPASDAWSLGALGWYALTGDLPPVDAVDRAAQLIGPDFAAALAPLLERDPARRTRAGMSAGRIYGAAAAIPLQLAAQPAPQASEAPLVDDAPEEADAPGEPDASAHADASGHPDAPGGSTRDPTIPLPVVPVRPSGSDLPDGFLAEPDSASGTPVDDPWSDHTRVRLSWGDDVESSPSWDETSTERGRAAAPAGVLGGTTTRPPLRAAAMPTRQTSREADPPPRVRRPAARPGRSRRRLSTGWRALVLALAVVVFVGVFIFVLAHRPAAGTSGALSAPSTPTQSTVTGADSLAQGDASAAEILQGLVDARAAAISAGDVALLDRAELPSSAPYDTDAALIARLASASQTYAGLRFVVRDVVVRSRTDTRIELTAVVARDGYTLVGDGGVRSPRPGALGASYTYELTRTPAGWRLSALTALAPTGTGTPSTPGSGSTQPGG